MSSRLLRYSASYYFVRESALNTHGAEVLIAHALGQMPALAGVAEGIRRGATAGFAGAFSGTIAVHPNFPSSRMLGMVACAAGMPKAGMLALCLKMAAHRIGYAVECPILPGPRVRSALHSYGFMHENHPTWRLVSALLCNRLLARPKRHVDTRSMLLFDAEEKVGTDAEAIPEAELEYFSCLPYRLGKAFPELCITPEGLLKLVDTMLSFGESLDSCISALKLAVKATSPVSCLAGKTVHDVEKLLLALQEKN